MDIWSWSNAVDVSGALVSSDVGDAGELLAANVRDPRVGKIWRAASMPATLNIALPAFGDISVFGLFGVNFASLGIVTLKLGTTEGASDLWEQEIDPETLTLDRQAVFVLTDDDGELDPVAASYATIEAASGEPMEIGRIWIGGADWQGSHTYEGTGWSSDDLSVRSRTSRSGAFLIDRGARLRSFTAAYRGLGPTDYGGALLSMDSKGLAQQMLCIPTPDTYDPHNFAILGYLAEMPSTQWRTLLLAERSVTIMEAG